MTSPSGQTGDARQRSAATKRARSRAALELAAAEVFAARGWLGARMEDIAHTAGVSTPTAYNHFPGGKQQLMGVVYRPFLDPLFETADRAIRSELDPMEAAVQVVTSLVRILKEHQQLSIALAAAAVEQALKAAWPTNVDPNDIRVMVPLSAPLAQVVEYGQLRGDFHDYPAAGDVSNYHTNAILLRVFAQPNEPTEDTTRVALSQLTRALSTP